MKTLEEYKKTPYQELNAREREHYEALRYDAQVEYALAGDKPVAFKVADARAAERLFKSHPELLDAEFVAPWNRGFLDGLPGGPDSLDKAFRVTGSELLSRRRRAYGESVVGKIHFKDLIWVRADEGEAYQAAAGESPNPLESGAVLPAFNSPWAEKYKLTEENKPTQTA